MLIKAGIDLTWVFSLVDDEANFTRVIGKGLRERGYAVDVAGDGEEALRMALCARLRSAHPRRDAAAEGWDGGLPGIARLG